jgi:hypothetical protein
VVSSFVYLSAPHFYVIEYTILLQAIYNWGMGWKQC